MTESVKSSCSDIFFSAPLSSRRKSPRATEPDVFPANAIPWEERELLDVCSFPAQANLAEVCTNFETSGPFAEVSSPQPTSESAVFSRRDGQGCCFSANAPTEIECSMLKCSTFKDGASFPPHPIGASRNMKTNVKRRLGKQHSFPLDMDREEAWERKKELYGVEEETSSGGDGGCSVSRTASDCGERAWSVRTRPRSLTDEDLEELRGCIDLGFGFNANDSDCELAGTLPALQLYYAINRQYLESQSRASPPSPLSNACKLSRTSSNSNDSTGSPHGDSWRISSPGDTPGQVKTRLRHWAQAVACSVKQGFTV